jgi:hypothetical protein
MSPATSRSELQPRAATGCGQAWRTGISRRPWPGPEGGPVLVPFLKALRRGLKAARPLADAATQAPPEAPRSAFHCASCGQPLLDHHAAGKAGGPVPPAPRPSLREARAASVRGIDGGRPNPAMVRPQSGWRGCFGRLSAAPAAARNPDYPSDNRTTSHSIFTQKMKPSGDACPRMVESTVFGGSESSNQERNCLRRAGSVFPAPEPNPPHPPRLSGAA